MPPTIRYSATSGTSNSGVEPPGDGDHAAGSGEVEHLGVFEDTDSDAKATADRSHRDRM